MKLLNNLFLISLLYLTYPTLIIGQDFEFKGIYFVPTAINRFQVQKDDLMSLNAARFIPNFPTIVLIHGFGVNGSTEFDLLATLIKGGVQANFFQIGWGPEARNYHFPAVNQPLSLTPISLSVVIPSYLAAINNLPLVAKAVASYFVWLHDTGNIKGEDIHFVGHSLGAHLSGYAASLYREWTNGDEIGRISGLDPAAPLYTFANLPLVTANRPLDGNDAKFVDIYLTSAKTVGAARDKIKNVDAQFIVNGGSIQPGCTGIDATVLDNLVFPICSHIYAIYFFRDSVSREVWGCKCTFDYPPSPLGQWLSFVNPCLINCPGFVRAGFYVPQSAKGTYMVRFNASYGIQSSSYVVPQSINDQFSLVPSSGFGSNLLLNEG